MSATFKPNHVPSDVIARWPSMALALWKRSFTQQAAILLAAALVKFLPAWTTVIGLLLAPPLFILAFAAVQAADEKAEFSWSEWLEAALPGALRMGYLSLQFTAGFGLVMAALAGVSSALMPAAQQAGIEEATRILPLPVQHDSTFSEFVYFCATWAEGVMTMVFLGMLMIAIYHGVFGAVLHAQQKLSAREARVYGWQAWQVNSESIEEALRKASPHFWYRLGIIAFAVICAFQTVYLSPIGLVVATYIPCLAYVAYRSIFLGRHQNVPASAQARAEQTGALVPAYVRRESVAGC